jgi:hypothetical protein
MVPAHCGVQNSLKIRLKIPKIAFENSSEIVVDFFKKFLTFLHGFYIIARQVVVSDLQNQKIWRDSSVG